MSNENSTIWMNVTTSYNWQRPPVGIVRVERLICSELALLYGSRFKKCIWSNGHFIELETLKEDKNTSINLPSYTNPNREVNSKHDIEFIPIYPILSKIDALIAIAQGALSLMPTTLRVHFNNFLHYLRPKIHYLISKKNNTYKSKKIEKKTPIEKKIFDNPSIKDKSPFNQGDVLISVGLDWDYPYYKEFYNIKKKFNIKIITCCYDLIPVLYPQYCVNNVAGIFTSYFIEIADGSDLILCISKQSEKDLNEMLKKTGGAEPLTHVFPLGDNIPKKNENEEISGIVKHIIEQKFILFVSTIERRKNHEVLYRAYHLLCREGKKSELPKLIFVGMPGWGVGDLLKDIELDPLISDMIIILNHVNDSELNSLYHSSFFCVFPSLYEGWGLPVGEALSLGKAVICSDRGSLPEVGGHAVCYVNPWSPDAWAENIYRMITDTSWRNGWENKASNIYLKKKWLDSAKSIKNRIDFLISNPEQ